MKRFTAWVDARLARLAGVLVLRFMERTGDLFPVMSAEPPPPPPPRPGPPKLRSL